MGKVIAIVIVIILAVGAWWTFSQINNATTPSNETVTEPIEKARDLQQKATSPSRGTIDE